MKNIFASEKIKVIDVAKLSLGGYLLYIGINFIASMAILFGGIKLYGWQIGDRALPFVDKNILDLSSNLDIGIIAFVIVFVMPLIEEILFRGLLQSYLMETIEAKSSEFLQKFKNLIVVISTATTYALLIATLFGGFNKILPIFVFGLIASAITVKSKSLYPAIILHILKNLSWITIEIFLFKL
ncbi:MAG: CPBP family intramembrane metalloprotease [Candidatus Peregrinibacteria bacterium]|nr:CPBP family intramembrane metalloprotease [Candidatus Peregrinibacteria bacterium]